MTTKDGGKSGMVELSVEDITFSVGTIVEGILLRKSVVDIAGREVSKYYISSGDGQIKSFLSTAVLEKSLRLVPVGSYVSIERTGQEHTKTGSMHLYKIMVQKSLAADISRRYLEAGALTEEESLKRLAQIDS